MIEFEKLIWPKRSRMEALAEVLPKDILLNLIIHFADRPEQERIIKLPKRQTILKVLAFYYGSKVADGDMSWDEVMAELKGHEFKTLKELDVDRKKFRRLFFQRQRELIQQIRKDMPS